jgi:hypothetical protein
MPQLEDDLDFSAAPPEAVAAIVPQPEEVQEPEVLAPLPAVVDYDTQKAVTRLYLFEKRVNELLAKSRKITAIRSEADNTLAAESASELTTLEKDIEAARKHFTAPHTKFNSTVNAATKNYSDPVGKEKNRQKMMLTGWYNAQEMEKRRKEAAAREEARRIQAEVDAEAERQRQEAQKKVDDAAAELAQLKAGEPGASDRVAALEKTIEEETVAANAETPLVAFPVVAEQDKVVRTAAGSASFAHDWTFEIQDVNLIPRNYLVPDEKAIRQAVKGGMREIPGIRIFEQTMAKVRA